MRLHRSFWLALGFEIISAALLLAQGTYKVESIGAPADLPQALADALEPAGARLVNDQGAAVAEVWLRKSIPIQQTQAKGDVAYPQLSVGTLVGVLRFPNGGSDFRGQSIKAGTYTLRYAQIPQDGNHLGASTYRDFLLLGPAATDTNVDRPLTFDAVVKLSQQASGTGHPAVLSLEPAAEAKTHPPYASQDDQGHWMLVLGTPSGPPLSIVLVGKTEVGG
jgi:hypothetical protein